MEKKRQGIDEDKLAEGQCNSPETCATEKRGISEDWLAVCIGLFIFVLSLGVFAGVDLLGFGITTGIWTDISKALKPVAKSFAGFGRNRIFARHLRIPTGNHDNRRCCSESKDRKIHRQLYGGILHQLHMLDHR